MKDQPAQKTAWTHGCDACDADEPVEYVAPLGYLCEACRSPERLTELRRELDPRSFVP